MADRLQRPTTQNGETDETLVSALERKQGELEILLVICNGERNPQRFAELACLGFIVGELLEEPWFADIEVLRGSLIDEYPCCTATCIEEAFDTVQTWLSTGVVDFELDADFALITETVQTC